MSPSVYETRRRFDEYATLEYLLTGDLRAALAETPGEETRRWLAGVVASLVESLPSKMQLTLDLDVVSSAILGRRPSAAVFGDLHAAQRQLQAGLEEIQRLLLDSPRLDAASAEPASAESAEARALEVSRRLLEWLEQLADHNRAFLEAARPLLHAPETRRRHPKKSK